MKTSPMGAPDPLWTSKNKPGIDRGERSFTFTDERYLKLFDGDRRGAMVAGLSDQKCNENNIPAVLP